VPHTGRENSHKQPRDGEEPLSLSPIGSLTLISATICFIRNVRNIHWEDFGPKYLRPTLGKASDSSIKTSTGTSSPDIDDKDPLGALHTRCIYIYLATTLLTMILVLVDLSGVDAPTES
jgi:hypothetical protein